MMRLNRLLPAVALACASAFPFATLLHAEDPPAADPAAPAPLKPAAPKAKAPADAPAPDATPADPAAPAPTKPAAPKAKAPADAPAPDAAPAPAPGPAPSATDVPANVGGAGTALPVPPGTALADSTLVRTTEDFYHFARIGRYKFALEKGEALKAVPDTDYAQALTTVAQRRGDDPIVFLLRLQTVETTDLSKEDQPKLRQLSVDLVTKFRKAQDLRGQDPAYIEGLIKRLSVNERAYQLALTELRQVGELAVPFMVLHLRVPAERSTHPYIVRALIDMGRQALNPLVACTEMTDDQDALISIINVLGRVGYDAAAPYLARLTSARETPAPVRNAAEQALSRLNASEVRSDPAKGFADLGERFYYNNASIASDRRNPTASIWTWSDPHKALDRAEVPPGIFNDLMAMRSCEYSLKLNPASTDTAALWLASAYKREVELKAGSVDPINANKPTADYWGGAFGTAYLEKVVSRAMHDRNSAVTLNAVKTLAKTAGPANLFSTQTEAMVDALRYPDRLVRFEAAAALAAAMPKQPFAGRERVVPILSDAIVQTGKPSAMVVASAQDEVNQITESLKAAGYNAQGGLTPQAAVAASAALPSVDAIVVSEKVPRDQIDALLGIVNQTARLERAPRVFIVTTNLSPWTAASVGDPLIATSRGVGADVLGPAIAAARARSGVVPLDEAMAKDYALRAADILYTLKAGGSTVFDLMPVESTLLGALDDARPEVAKAAAKIVGLLDSQKSQQRLLEKAVDEKTADDSVKVAMFQSLSSSARLYGNKLESAQVDTLQKMVETAANLDVRAAAAGARGALNLPPQQTTQLVIQQSIVPSVGTKTDAKADASR